MSDATTTPTDTTADNSAAAPDVESVKAAMTETFSTAFFAALTGICSRSNIDPGSAVNEAFTIAERSVERHFGGTPVKTEAERAADAQRRLAAAQAPAPGAPPVTVSGATPAQAPNVTVTAGRFARPQSP